MMFIPFFHCCTLICTNVAKNDVRPRSTDLFKNLCEILKLKGKKSGRSYNKAELCEVLKKTWREMTHGTCAKFIESMPGRTTAVIKHPLEEQPDI